MRIMGAIISAIDSPKDGVVASAHARFIAELCYCGNAWSPAEADARWIRVCERTPGLAQFVGGRARFDKLAAGVLTFTALQTELVRIEFEKKADTLDV
jgi:hypothetical protein